MAITTQLFRWGNYYRIGLEEIDRQHEQLAILINGLHTAWLDGAPRPELTQRLQALITAAAAHFETEEKIIAKAGYPGFQLHQSEHAFVITHLGELQQDLDIGIAKLSKSTLTYLKDWLRDHILISDKRMAEYLLTH